MRLVSHKFHSLLYARLDNVPQVNIQSHYIGVVIFASLWLYHLQRVYIEHQKTLNVADTIFMSFFMAGALTCLFLSGSYHMMGSHSKPVGSRGLYLYYIDPLR